MVAARPTLDPTGNMTTAPKPSSLANGLTLKYDAWNRLVEVKDGQTVVGKYEYDGLNRRIKKHLDSQSPGDPNGIDKYEHYFYNAAWQVLETRETTTENDQPENLQPKYQYVWSARYIDSPVLRDENTDQDGLCDDERLYYLTDANFNVTTLVDTAGDAIERYLYDPYGKPTIYTGTWSSTRPSSLYSNPYLYTGREYDAETGLYHYRHRHYHAELGRFLSRDPIGYYAGSPSLYEYVGSNPVRFVDPRGLLPPDDGIWPIGPTPPGYVEPGLPPWWPAPGITFPRASRPNTQLFWGGAHYLFCCPRKKKDRLKAIPNPGKRPSPPPPGGRLPNGNNQFFAGPAEVGGCATCIGVVISCPGGTAVFHFNTMDNPGRTLDDWTWPATCKAVVCGGWDQKESNCLADDVLEALDAEGIEVVGVSGAEGCGVNANGDFYEVR